MGLSATSGEGRLCWLSPCPDEEATAGYRYRARLSAAAADPRGESGRLLSLPPVDGSPAPASLAALGCGALALASLSGPGCTCGVSAAPGLSAVGGGTGDHSSCDGDGASASRVARGTR